MLLAWLLFRENALITLPKKLISPNVQISNGHLSSLTEELSSSKAARSQKLRGKHTHNTYSLTHIITSNQIQHRNRPLGKLKAKHLTNLCLGCKGKMKVSCSVSVA
ncbi:hypothetical protein NC652_039709 [Populus alba x Populus x berolinensis]|nr:hypothetical protein NC652_039709 [Populus alba x Populus x berolinensis]